MSGHRAEMDGEGRARPCPGGRSAPDSRSSYRDPRGGLHPADSTPKESAQLSTTPNGESDKTPRFEAPSTIAASGGAWIPQRPAPTLPSSVVTGDTDYFAPQPLRYHPSTLPASGTTSTDLSASSSRNTSTTSLDASTTYTGPLHHDRPAIQRDPSTASTASSSTVRPASTDYSYQTSSGQKVIRDYPQFPNQSYSALHSQSVFERWREATQVAVPQRLRTRSSHPSQYSSFSTSQKPPLGTPHLFDYRAVAEPSSKTAGNSPAGSPGLFTLPSPSTTPARPPVGTPDEHGFYSSPYLHFTHRQAPKETHVADVDVDPVSGRKVINQYEIIDELGRGVHGKVKLGRSLETGQYVAIKIVDRFSKRRRLGKSNSHEDKIRREIAILKKARHPNIVGLLEVIDDPSRRKVYIVLEHVEMGEVKWRTKASPEIALVEYRRYKRCKDGIEENEATRKEDEMILRAARHQRARKERRRLRELQRHKQDESSAEDAHTWSFEHGGSSGDEEDDVEKLSRISSSSTVSNHDPNPDDNEGDSEKARRSLEGTMYGAYLPEIPRGRRPSAVAVGSTPRGGSPEEEFVPEHFQYVPLMTLSAARSAFRDTVLGVEYLHYNNVIHRDIKPANLLQTKDHRIKISDFGVSYLGRSSEEENVEDHSETDAAGAADEAVELAKTVGTPAFYAPELCRTDLENDADAPPVTNQIDIWALGVTLYCLVFGRVPFHDNNTFVLMRLIADEPVYLPRHRLKAVDEQSSRPNSHGRNFFLANNNKRSPYDLDYEAIDDDLYDLFTRLFVKDPRKRINIHELKRHPWILQDLPIDPVRWLEETDPRRQTEGRRIEVSEKELDEAVVPLTLVDHIRSGIRRIGGALGLGKSSSVTRKRAKSGAGNGESSTGLSSAASSSSTISQDARRGSLRVDDAIFSALKNSRDTEHPLSYSVTASPEGREKPDFFTPSRPQTPNIPDLDDSPPLTLNTISRPYPLDRAQSTMSTAGSIKTVRQTDYSRGSREVSPSIPPALPGTPLALDTPGGSNLGGIFGGVPRRLINSVRGREKPSRNQDDQFRAKSTDRLVGADDDAHAGPSIALSNTLAAGHVDLPAKLKENSNPSSPIPLSRNSPADYWSGKDGRVSRQSSVSSAASQKNQAHAQEDAMSQHVHIDHFSMYRESPDDKYNRTREELARRRAFEERHAQERPRCPVHSRPPSGLSHSTCPPHLDSDDDDDDDDDSLEFRKPRLDEIFGIPQYSQSSSEVSPTEGAVSTRRWASSSSEDHGTISQSTSNPSIPSAASATSSVAPDGYAPALEESPKGSRRRSSDDTVNQRRTYVPSVTYNETIADSAIAESADDEESDDDFLELTRFKSSGQGRGHSAIVRSGSISNAEISRRRLRRSTGGSRKSNRSGSNRTVKKVRSRDLDDEEFVAHARSHSAEELS